MSLTGPDSDETSLDAFHLGRFYLVQPRGRGHRAGMDAMVLASTIPDDAAGRLADLGAGAGAAGLAVASRVPGLAVTLIERAEDMLACARASIALPHNRRIADRVFVQAGDVTLKGRARREAGLGDDHFDHVIMNPPFNDRLDRKTPDPLKADAHAMGGPDMFEAWIRTAGAILKPGGMMALIARPQSLAVIVQACAGRFGGLEITSLHPRAGDPAIRILVTAIKGSRARLTLRFPLVIHGEAGHGFTPAFNDLNNGRASYIRL